MKKVFRAGKADLALLELVEEVDLDIYTPVCLPRRGESFLNKRVLALGNSVLFHFPGERVLWQVGGEQNREGRPEC